MDAIVVMQLLRRDEQLFSVPHHIVIMIISAIALEARSVLVQPALHLFGGTHRIVTKVEKIRNFFTVDGIMVEHPDICSGSTPAPDPGCAIREQAIMPYTLRGRSYGIIVPGGKPEVEIGKLDIIEPFLTHLLHPSIIGLRSVPAFQQFILIGPGDPVILTDIFFYQVFGHGLIKVVEII